ncbi:hypothetical protein [Pseudofrankia sp. EUN1h]|uniref:hypothetical protein n=1 Tax=Pseudofrankia sp. EUN1h TaxID=1834515 RepID=UPI0012FE8416|nr:hypothetical protein [Pseudofrankia sp. EUN1h]
MRQGYATVVGQARGITQRQESYGDNQSSTVLTFRLERYDTDGNRLRPVPVQMRTIGFDGALGDGDEILVSGQWKDGTLHSQRMENLTTGGAVKGRSIKKMLLICLAALVAMAVVIGGFAIYSEHSQTQNFCEQAAHEGIRPPMC